MRMEASYYVTRNKIIFVRGLVKRHIKNPFIKCSGVHTLKQKKKNKNGTHLTRLLAQCLFNSNWFLCAFVSLNRNESNSNGIVPILLLHSHEINFEWNKTTKKNEFGDNHHK